MLLDKFYSNDPSGLFLLALVVPVLMAVGWGVAVEPDHASGMLFFNFILELLSGRLWAHVLVQAFLVIICAVQIAALLNKLEYLDRKTHLSALCFALIVCSSISMQSLNPIMCGSPFVLWALRRSWSAASEQNTLAPHFDAGLLVGVASMFYFPYILLLAALWVSMAFMRTFSWRGWLFPAIGVGLVFLFVSTGHYLFGEGMPAPGQWQQWSFDLDMEWPAMVLWLFNIALFFWSLYWYIHTYQHSKMRRKNLMKAIGGLTFFLLLLFGFSGLRNESYRFTLLAIPSAIFISTLFYTLYEKKRWLANVVFYLWLAVLLLSVWSERTP